MDTETFNKLLTQSYELRHCFNYSDRYEKDHQYLLAAINMHFAELIIKAHKEGIERGVEKGKDIMRNKIDEKTKEFVNKLTKKKEPFRQDFADLIIEFSRFVTHT